MAERTAILIDRYGEVLGVASNPLYVGGIVSVGSLVELTDVAIASPVANDFIGYDEVTGKYVNKPVSGSGMGDVTGPTGATARSIAIYGDSSGKTLANSTIVIDLSSRINMAGNRIISIGEPTASSDAATKNYVDQYVQGLSWQEPVLSVEVSSPPGPSDAARYIVSNDAEGDWIGHESDIAVWGSRDGAWTFYPPEAGWACYNADLSSLMVYNADTDTWTNIGASGVPEAPSTGSIYGRQDAAWVAVPALSHVHPIATAVASGFMPQLNADVASFLSGDGTWRAVAGSQVNSDWTAAVGVASILNKPTLGTAAALDVGTVATNVVQLDASARIPAVDGSLLTGISASSVSISSRSSVATKRGQAVYIVTGNSALPDVALCDNTVTAKSRIFGLVVADGSIGDTISVRRSGVVTNVDTRTTNTAVNPNAETWVEGDLLFATTNGGLTKTRPTSGRVVKAGYSLKGSGVTDSILLFPMENPVWVTCAANESVVLRAGDAAGAYGVSIRDYANVEVASITSDGGVNIATGQTYNIGGVPHTHPAPSGGQYLNKWTQEGVLFETTFLPWIAPASCVVASADIYCESTGALTKVQIMKNGTLETNSIFGSDIAIQVASTDTQMTYGGYFGWSALDSGQTALAKGDKIYVRVNQADVGGADLLVQLRCTIS